MFEVWADQNREQLASVKLQGGKYVVCLLGCRCQFDTLAEAYDYLETNGYCLLPHNS